MDIREVINNKSVQIGGVGIGCFLAGAASGYFYAKKTVNMADDIFVEEVEDLTLPFDEVEEEDEDDDIVDSGTLSHSAPELEQLIDNWGQNSDDEPVEEPVRNIFTREDSWDYDLETSQRSSEKPYVIHRDEFFSDELGFTQLTFTYYAGDDILTDEQDTPVHNYRTIVGPMKFGHGSLDQNVFYARNEELNCEYEILHSDSFYSIEVLGYGLESEYEEQDSKEVPLKFKDD